MKINYENFFNKLYKKIDCISSFKFTLYDNIYDCFLDIFQNQWLTVFINEYPYKIKLIWDIFEVKIILKDDKKEIIILNNEIEYIIKFDCIEIADNLFKFLTNSKINIHSKYSNPNCNFKKICNKDIIGINYYDTYWDIIKEIELKNSKLLNCIKNYSINWKLDEFILKNLNNDNIYYGIINIIDLNDKSRKNDLQNEDYYNLLKEKIQQDIVNKSKNFYLYINKCKLKLPNNLDYNKFYLFDIKSRTYKVLQLNKLNYFSSIYFTNLKGYKSIVKYKNKDFLFSNKFVNNYLKFINLLETINNKKSKLFLKFDNCSKINWEDDEKLFNIKHNDFCKKLMWYISKYSENIAINSTDLNLKVNYMNKTLNLIEKYFENWCLYKSHEINVNMLKIFIKISYNYIIEEILNPFLRISIYKSDTNVFFKFIKFSENLFNFYNKNFNTKSKGLKTLISKFEKNFYILSYNKFLTKLNNNNLISHELKNLNNSFFNDLIFFLKKYFRKYQQSSIKLVNKIINLFLRKVKIDIINNPEYNFSSYIDTLKLYFLISNKLVLIKKFFSNTKFENEFNYIEIKNKIVKDFYFINNYLKYEIEIFIKNILFENNNININKIINKITNRINGLSTYNNKYLYENIYTYIFYKISFYYGFKILFNCPENNIIDYLNLVKSDINYLKEFFEAKTNCTNYNFIIKLFEEIINFLESNDINILIKSIINFKMWYNYDFNTDILQIILSSKGLIKNKKNYILNYFNELNENYKKKLKRSNLIYFNEKIIMNLYFIYKENKYLNYKSLLNDINLFELSSLNIDTYNNKFEASFNLYISNDKCVHKEYSLMNIILKKKKLEIKDLNNNLINYYFLRNIWKLKRVSNGLIILKTNNKYIYLNSDNYHNLNLFEKLFRKFYEEFDKFFKKEILELEINEILENKIQHLNIKKSEFLVDFKEKKQINNNFNLHKIIKKELKKVNNKNKNKKLNIIHINDLCKKNNKTKASNIKDLNSNNIQKTITINFKRRKTIEIDISDDETEIKEDKENINYNFTNSYMSKSKYNEIKFNNDILNDFSRIDQGTYNDKIERSVWDKLKLFK